MEILPIGDPILETFSSYSARVSRTVASWSLSRSRMLVPHALRTSTWLRPRPEAILHCSLKSSEISSINPESVHIVLCPSSYFVVQAELFDKLRTPPVEAQRQPLDKLRAHLCPDTAVPSPDSAPPWCPPPQLAGQPTDRR